MKKILDLLNDVYSKEESDFIFQGIQTLWMKYEGRIPESSNSLLNEKDVVLISYGDQLQSPDQSSLASLESFYKQHLQTVINMVHLLPFYPYSSDDGFSVIDYFAVDDNLGSWEDIERFSEKADLMFDAVINHNSQHSSWFKAFLAGEEEFKEYYIEVKDPEAYPDLVRPRTSPFWHEFPSHQGPKPIWTTFSKDQVDLNYAQAKVFLHILEVLFFYLSKGARLLRLDAIGFMWKEKNTSCIHLEQTHTLIKVMRQVLEKAKPNLLLITETNVPHQENISYFGQGDEAHLVYNFTLPPLLAYSILAQEADKLGAWLRELSLEFPQTCFFNFLASHDGVGLRPVESILKDSEKSILIEAAEANGGKVSYRERADAPPSPYEINCNYFSLLKGKEEDEALGLQRFKLAHAFLLSLPGLPAIYFHSLLGSENDWKGLAESGQNRRINREKFMLRDLEEELKDPQSWRSKVLAFFQHLLHIRQKDSAFDPYGKVKVVSIKESVLGLIRENPQSQSKLWAYFNFSAQAQEIPLDPNFNWQEQIKGEPLSDHLPLEGYGFAWVKQI